MLPHLRLLCPGCPGPSHTMSPEATTVKQPVKQKCHTFYFENQLEGNKTKRDQFQEYFPYLTQFAGFIFKYTVTYLLWEIPHVLLKDPNDAWRLKSLKHLWKKWAFSVTYLAGYPPIVCHGWGERNMANVPHTLHFVMEDLDPTQYPLRRQANSNQKKSNWPF